MTEQDYDAVRALWLTIRGFGIRALDDSREDIVRFIRRNPTTSVVAEMDGSIIGSILCGSDGRQGALYHVCVAKNYRRQGIGTRMVGYCMQQLKEMGIPLLFTCYPAGIIQPEELDGISPLRPLGLYMRPAYLDK